MRWLIVLNGLVMNESYIRYWTNSASTTSCEGMHSLRGGVKKKMVLLGGAHHKVATPLPQLWWKYQFFLSKIFFLLRIPWNGKKLSDLKVKFPPPLPTSIMQGYILCISPPPLRGINFFPHNLRPQKFLTQKDEFLHRLPVWRVCKDRTHTVNDYYLLKLKIKIKILKHSTLKDEFFPSSPLPASPQP